MNAKNRKDEITQIKKISIVELLRDMGYEPYFVSNNRVRYYSPLHREKQASFIVYIKPESSDDWYDFGLQVGGSIIDLVMKFWGIEYVEAVKKLRLCIKENGNDKTKSTK